MGRKSKIRSQDTEQQCIKYPTKISYFKRIKEHCFIQFLTFASYAKQ